MIELGSITLEQVNHARRAQMTANGKRIGEWLVELGHATADHVRHALEIQQQAGESA